MIFKELRYILAVKECGNLSKAAEKLYLTQPALSRYIKNLEDSLDIKLFEHSGRKLILTDAGLRYVDAAYKMLDMYEDLLNDLHASDDTIRGSLRVGTTRQRGPMLLPGIVTRFHHSFPNVKLSLFEENSFTLEKMLADGFNLGGEQSGHVILLDYNTTGDGLVTAVQVISAMVSARLSTNTIR